MRSPRKVALATAATLLGLIAAVSPSAARSQIVPRVGSAPAASADVARMAEWVLASGDNRGLPFAIIDKVEAEVFIFGPRGELRGATTVLLGVAAGDDSTAGVGDRELANIPPRERTTPAGRFVSGFGRAAGGRSVFWVDYATAISLHPVVTTNRKERRLQRLQTPSPEDNRITYGCINVAASFFNEVVTPTFKGTTAVVYILPDTKALGDVFPTFSLQTGVSSRDERARAQALADGPSAVSGAAAVY
jgi:hypothetical protein